MWIINIVFTFFIYRYIYFLLFSFMERTGVSKNNGINFFIRGSLCFILFFFLGFLFCERKREANIYDHFRTTPGRILLLQRNIFMRMSNIDAGKHALLDCKRASKQLLITTRRVLFFKTSKYIYIYLYPLVPFISVGQAGVTITPTNSCSHDYYSDLQSQSYILAQSTWCHLKI